MIFAEILQDKVNDGKTIKESSAQYLADLEEIRKAYVQDVKENYSNNSIPQNSEKSTENSEIFASDVIPELSEIGEVQTKERADVQHYLNANVNTEIINFCGICIYRSARI